MFRPLVRLPARPRTSPSAPPPPSRPVEEIRSEAGPTQQNRPPPIPTRDEQAEYIRKLQTEKADVEKQLAESRLINLKDRRRGRGRKSKADNQDIGTLILRFAKRYLLCGQAWLPLSTHQLALARPPVEYLPSMRYSNAELDGNATLTVQQQSNRTDGMLWELYSLLPDSLEEEDLSKTFFETVNGHMSDYRSHIQNRLRANIQTLLRGIAPLSNHDLANVDDAEYRSTNQAFLYLQGYTEDLNEDGLHYQLMPPILLGGNDADPAEQRWFRNPLIERVLVLILLGPSALKAGKPWKHSNGALADLLGINRVNASLLAFAATLSRFLISPEKEFSMKARGSGVQWPTQYEQYKMLLWDDSVQPFQRLLEELNSNIFGVPSTTTRPDATLINVTVTTNQLQALRRILAEESILRPSVDNSAIDQTRIHISRDNRSGVPSPESNNQLCDNTIQTHYSASPLLRSRNQHNVAPASASFSTPRRITDPRSNAVTPSSAISLGRVIPRVSPRLNQQRSRRAKENALALGHVESEEEAPAAPLRRIRQKKQRNKMKGQAAASKSIQQHARSALAPLNGRPITRSQR